MRSLETVIIGGGIAGLACARRLSNAGRDFVLVTDRLGGRLHASSSGLPYGAVYVTTDYKQVSRYVGRGRRIRLRDIYFRDGARLRTLFHPGNLRHRRALFTLYARLITFRRHLNRLRARCPHACQAQLLSQDALLMDHAQRPARSFIAEHGLEELNDVFTEPMVRSTVFVGTDRINAFYYLAVLMPILLPTYVADFSGTLAKLTRGFGDRIALGSVERVDESVTGGHLVHTSFGDLRSTNLVIATPCHNTRRFCPDLPWASGEDVQEISMSTLHVAGRRRAAYMPGKTVFLRADQPATILFPVTAKQDVLFSHENHPDLHEYYEDHAVVGQVRWKTAVILSGATWRPLNPRPGLYVIGDHNVCGLEDSFLTGLYAANHILGRADPSQIRPYMSRPGFTESPVR